MKRVRKISSVVPELSAHGKVFLYLFLTSDGETMIGITAALMLPVDKEDFLHIEKVFGEISLDELEPCLRKAITWVKENLRIAGKIYLHRTERWNTVQAIWDRVTAPPAKVGGF